MKSGSRLLDAIWHGLWHWEGDCCVWHGHHAGSKTKRPAASLAGKKVYVSRAVVEEKCGKLSKGLFGLHVPPCRNVSCVNPSHLRPGTHSQNMMDQPYPVRHEKASKAGKACYERNTK